ncbi:MAG: hypothetical protein RIF39_15545, partial [Cyclobacteriaceae bacterium]
MKHYLYILICWVIPSLIFAQQGKVLVQNAYGNTPENPSVNIKWYSQSLTYQRGVNIYRRVEGEQNWVKLNNSPIVLQQVVPSNLLQGDEDLDAFVEMAADINQSSNNGFMLLNLFVKSFQSQDFSRLIGIQFDDTQVEWGNSYHYKVMKIVGRADEELGVVPIVVGNYKPLGAVQDFEAKLDEGIVKIKWKQEEDRFYGVNVYKRSSLDTVWQRLNKTPIVLSEAEGNAPDSDTMFQDINIQEGITYSYKLAGLDFFGGETEKTKQIMLEVKDSTPPPAPFNLSKSVKNQKVTLSWNIPLSSDIHGFNVYRSVKSDGPFEKVNSVQLKSSDSVYNDSVSIGFYYYYVVSVDLTGNEAPSNTILAEVQDTTPPAPPEFVIAQSDTGKVLLSWHRNRESDLAGYHIFRKIGSEDQSDFLLVNSLAIRDTTYTQLLPKNAANEFSFRVVAVDTSFNKSLPSASVTVRLPDVTPPIQPFIKNASQQGDTIMVEWLPNPEPDLAGYRLKRFKGDSPNAINLNNSMLIEGANVFVDTISVSGLYHYQLIAVDRSGNESIPSAYFSNEVSSQLSLGFSEIEASYSK